MRIGYFGGSFDPPHRGHLAVARLARDRFGLDRVLLAPTARQPLKPGGPEAPWPDRLRMTELLCLGEPGLEASAIDGPRPDGAPNYTVDTLRRLRIDVASRSLSGCHSRRESASSGCHPRSRGPHRAHLLDGVGRGSASPPAAPELFAILGADAFLTLPQWREPDELLRLADWIVVSRPGAALPQFDTLSLTPAQRTRIHVLDTLADPTSATDLRARLHTGKDCRELIPDAVLAYIAAHSLYGQPRRSEMGASAET